MSPDTKIDWNTIFSTLDSWQKKTSEQGSFQNGMDEPSVTTVSGEHDKAPWAILVSTIISLRTRDAVTLSSSRKLLAKAPCPDTTRKLAEEEIASLIYPAGFYRNKARSILAIAKILKDRGDQVPDTLEELLELPGVGLKTANLVLSEAFDKDAICVDIHVHRISNRNGWVRTKSPDETEAALRNIMPVQFWKKSNALLVMYGQNICTPLRPKCDKCVLVSHCQHHGRKAE